MLFYPSHDIALANGLRHFNPPAMAIHLQEDLAYLSDIWNQSFLRGETQIPIPWGWDFDTRTFIHREFGIKMNQLPTDDQLSMIRNLSSRQTTIRLCHEMSISMPNLQYTQPTFLDSEAAVFDYIRQHDELQRPFVFKTPWSSSGRGLMLSQNKAKDGNLYPQNREVLISHARQAIRKMGGIMVEEWIGDKKQDFAMLFSAKDDVRFIGYSLFDNDDRMGGITYRNGYLKSNEEIERILDFDPSTLHQIASNYELILTQLFRPLLGQEWTLGYVGIDMIRTSHNLVPCIEMNLRCTMGTVCRLWYEQHRQEGIFRISPMQNDGHFRAEFIVV